MGKKNTKKTLGKRVKALEKCITEMSANMRTMADMLIKEKVRNSSSSSDLVFNNDADELVFTSASDVCECDHTDRLDDRVNLYEIAKMSSASGYDVNINFVLGDHMGDTITRSIIITPYDPLGFNVDFNGIPLKEIDLTPFDIEKDTPSAIIDHAVRYAMINSNHLPNSRIEKIWASITSYFVENETLEPFATVNEFADIDRNVEIIVYENDEYPLNGYSNDYEIMSITITFEPSENCDGVIDDDIINEEETKNE